jgi:hypothetical protein
LSKKTFENFYLKEYNPILTLLRLIENVAFSKKDGTLSVVDVPGASASLQAGPPRAVTPCAGIHRAGQSGGLCG